MQRIILGTLAAAVAAAALTGCDATFSASPSSSSTTQDGGSTHTTGGGQGSGSSSTTGSGNGSGGGSKGGSGTRHCTTSDLQTSLIAGHPAAGNRYATLKLRNGSDSTCTTGGWSGLGLVNGNGPIPTNVVREGKAHTITLEIGDSAYEQLHWSAVPAGNESGPNGAPTPTKLNIIPPNQTTHNTIPWSGGTVYQHGRISLTPMSLSFPG